MKKMFLKFLCVLMAAATVFSAVSCADNPPPSGTEGQGGDGIDYEKQIGTLAESGQTDYTILIPADASEPVQYAAEELQLYVSEATGAVLPVATDDTVAADLNGKYVSIGKTSLLRVADFDIDYDALNVDGYVVRTRNECVFIDGYRGSGTLYGTYDFLENFVGIRWLTPTYTYIPSLTEIPLYETSRQMAPVFANQREYMAYSCMNHKDYMAHLKFASTYGYMAERYGEGGSNAFFFGDAHNLQTLIPFDTYGADHPDWFYNRGTEFCYTNGITDTDEFDENDTDSLAAKLVQLSKDAILSNDKATNIMFGQPDNGDWCDCEDCAESLRRNGTRSGTLIVLMNAVAKEVKEWMAENGIDRDIKFITFAYWKTLDAPVQLIDGEFVPYNDNVVCRDDVGIKYAHMTCSYHTLNDPNCSSTQAAYNRLLQWSTVTKNLYIWDYATNYTDHFYWYPNFNSIAANIKLYRDIGVEALMTQGAPHVENYYQNWIENYVLSKLMWNPELDVNEIVREFNRYYFGEQSARAVDAFFELMQYHYATLDDEMHTFHNELYDTVGFKDPEHYPIAFLERACTLIEDEIARVEADTTLSEADKYRQTDKLYQVLIHPMYMILDNYDAYFNDGKKDYARSVFAICDRLGIMYYGENLSIATLKTEYGVA